MFKSGVGDVELHIGVRADESALLEGVTASPWHAVASTKAAAVTPREREQD